TPGRRCPYESPILLLAFSYDPVGCSDLRKTGPLELLPEPERGLRISPPVEPQSHIGAVSPRVDAKYLFRKGPGLGVPVSLAVVADELHPGYQVRVADAHSLPRLRRP